MTVTKGELHARIENRLHAMVAACRRARAVAELLHDESLAEDLLLMEVEIQRLYNSCRSRHRATPGMRGQMSIYDGPPAA